MKEIKLRENGPCTVSYGNIYGFDGCMIENPTVILDIDKENPDNIVTLIKYGNEIDIKSYYDNMIDKYKKSGFEYMTDNLILITFKMKTGFLYYDKMVNAKFNSDEICTLLNWLNNHIHVKSFLQFVNADENTMHEKLSTLADLGF